MTDINQWRRMIQTSRARTPATDGDESDGVRSPTTPRHTSKHRLPHHLTQHVSSAVSSRANLPFGGDLLLPDTPPWSIDTPAPDADRLVEVIMSRLLMDPHERLDSSFNGALLQIFERFRQFGDEMKDLQSSLQKEVDRRNTVEQAMHQSAKQWDRERQEYKAEVKRLELILAKGERGVAEVTIARQGSVMRRRRRDENGRCDRTLETIFELLERSRRNNEKLWGTQRATMRKRPVSPSAAMRRLSRQLVKGSPAVDFDHDLSSGGFEASLALAQQTVPASPMNSGSNERVHHPLHLEHPETCGEISEPRVARSSSSISTFSCDGDFLPDETANLGLIKVAGTDNDFVAMKRIAQVLAKRRQIDPDEVMPKLTQLFNEPPLEQAAKTSLVSGRPVHHPTSTAPERPIVRPGLAKHPTLKAKASGFFSKWRPHINADASNPTVVRRFSFEPGDDGNAALTAPPFENATWTVKDRLLRKSASMSLLAGIETANDDQTLPPLSPSVQSPTASVLHCESKKPSRIPTPVYSAASLARPRSEREDSAASLLTAINCRDGESLRSDSLSGSTHSSPVANQSDLVHVPDVVEETTLAISNPLLDHTNALRGTPSSAAAARAASTAPANVTVDSAQTKRQRMTDGRSNRSSQSRTVQGLGMDLGMTMLQSENDWPMGPTACEGDDQDSEAAR